MHLRDAIGGEVVLGSKKVPIVNPAVLQGGYTEGEGGGFANFAKLVAATNGVTLSKAPQPVPGGLAGLVNCKLISNFILKAACESTFENGLTGVNATLELARPANQVLVNENNLGGEIDTALKLPVKIRLENPLLGASCYVGSEGSPMYWNLTSGTTAPPAATEPITAPSGKSNSSRKAASWKPKEPNWSTMPGRLRAPAVVGEFSPSSWTRSSSTAAGLPAAAGKNSAILVNDVFIAAALAVKNNFNANL